MATTATIVKPSHFQHAIGTILRSGLVAGTLDGTDAAIFIGIVRHATVKRVFQFIASGAFGQRAFQGGWRSGALGIGFHFLIATGAAAVFYVLAAKRPSLLKRPFISGALFGVAVFFFMHYGVVAISAAPKRPFATIDFINQIFAHVFCVGIPIALLTQRARPRDR